MALTHAFPAATQTALAALCQAALVDALDLFHQTKQAHWNVQGPSFIGLHRLFDELVDAAEDYLDDLAERIRQLGSLADGTVGTVALTSQLPAYPALITQEKDHLIALLAALEVFDRRARSGIAQAEALGDRVTADLFTEIARGVEQWRWWLSAHLG